MSTFTYLFVMATILLFIHRYLYSSYNHIVHINVLAKYHSVLLRLAVFLTIAPRIFSNFL